MRGLLIKMSELKIIKQQLISLSTSTDIGFNCSPELKEQIETLSTKIETLNPTQAVTSQMELVQGRWQVLYSTFRLERETTLQRLAFGKLPNVTVNVTGIYQEIYTDGQKYNNLIEFTTSRGIKGIVSVAGRYRTENINRLNIDFLETSAFPATKDFNISEFKQALGVEDESTLTSALEFSGWSDISYLDENLRLMRGNQQNLYVLLRE